MILQSGGGYTGAKAEGACVSRVVVGFYTRHRVCAMPGGVKGWRRMRCRDKATGFCQGSCLGLGGRGHSDSGEWRQPGLGCVFFYSPERRFLFWCVV
jgi:hypothetical protein